MTEEDRASATNTDSAVVDTLDERASTIMSVPTTDYLADIRDLLRAQISSLSSVQLERTSRGVNVNVKAYSTDVGDAGRLAEAEYDRLTDKYDAS